MKEIESAMDEKEQTPVLIVGAGPTGLVLALWLKQLNIPVRIIDKAKHSGETSRALGVHARTLEFYRQIGLADALIAQGIKVENIAFYKNGKKISNIKLGDFGLGLSPYPYVLSLPQDDHEKILIARLKEMGVEVEWLTKLISFKEEGQKVVAEIENENGTQLITTTYLCGCDGARSTTRELANLSFPGGTYHQIFFVVDAPSPQPWSNDVELAVTRDEFCLVFPVRSSGTIRLVGIVPSAYENKKEISLEDVKETIFKNTRLKIDKANWFSTYHVHHRVVPKFKIGRVFLAGDAAHIHSPVGAQGMNTGIGDAVNLSWKLAAVLGENADEKLLETYEVERLSFANKLVSTTDKVFQIMTSNSFLGLAWRKVIIPYVLPFIVNIPSLSHYLFKFVSQIQINYRKSPLSLSSPAANLQAGDRLPWVNEFGKDNFAPLQQLAWQVHVYGIATPIFREKLQTLALPLFEFDWGQKSNETGMIQHAAYLIRPDGYISAIDIDQTGDDIMRLLLEIKKS